MPYAPPKSVLAATVAALMLSGCSTAVSARADDAAPPHGLDAAPLPGGDGATPDAYAEATDAYAEATDAHEPLDAAPDDRGHPLAEDAAEVPGAPRERGDVCPGAVLGLDGAPHRLDTRRFAGRADYLPACATAAAAEGRVDAVFSYTLSAMADVALEMSASGPGELSVDVADTCGARADARCATGNPARLLLRRQPPGTWFVTVSYRGAPGRALTATARSAAPAAAHATDRCPGVATQSSSSFTIPLAGLGPHTALACLPGARADAFFEHTAPPAGRDLVAVARSTRGAVALSLRERCAEPLDLACSRGPAMAWQRFAGLSPGARYTLVAAAGEADGTLAVDTFEAPAAPVVEVRGNGACAQAAQTSGGGGRFAGDTLGGTWGGAALCGGLACAGGRTVWFALQLSARARLLGAAVGEGFAPVLSVYAGEGCPGRLVPGGCGEGGGTARLDVTLDPGRYRIALAGCGPAAGGRYTLDWVTGPPDTRR